jgi:3'-5' exoribonuclease
MRTKVKDYRAGDEVNNLILRLVNVQYRKTTSQADYVNALGFDGEEILEVKIWNVTDSIRENLENGKIYTCSGQMKDYQGKLQFNLKELAEADPSLYRLEEFFEYAKLSVEELKEKIMNYVLKIENANIKKLVLAVLKEDLDAYFVHPAAKSVHHNYISGLAYHVYSMLKLADTYIELYPFLNSDLIYGGILLHDFGKITEMEKTTGEYTKQGNLLGHIVIASNILYEKAKELSLEESEEYLMLAHIIIAHHGFLEFGSPKEPTIPEAYVVFLCDYADSRMGALEKELKDGVKGEYSQPVFAFNKRIFYLPDLD